MTGLFLRGNVWWLRYSCNGRQQRESLGTSDESEAILIAHSILDDPERKDAKAWQQELRTYLQGRVASRRMSKSVEASRLAVLRSFGQAMGVTHPSMVTPSMGVEWYRALQKTISEDSAQTYLRWLSTFLDHLVDENKLRRNPVPLASLKFDRLKKAKKKPFCTPEQVRTLLDAAKTDEMRFILFCGFHAGMRRGEIAETRPEWFHVAGGFIHIQRSDTWEPKDRDDRSIPLTKEFSEFLGRYGLPSPFMLPAHRVHRRTGKWRYRYDFRRPFMDLVTGAGMPWVTPHTMRRTFASNLVSKGVSLYKVAIWLGDLEKVVQDHYGYLIPKDADIERAYGPAHVKEVQD